MKPTYRIYQEIANDKVRNVLPFIVVETFLTMDGYRSRILDTRYSSAGEAQCVAEQIMKSQFGD